MNKTKMKKAINKTVGRLIYKLDNQTNGGNIGTRYLELQKIQAKSDCKFFGTGTVETQSKFFFIDHLLESMEYPNRFTIADIIRIVPGRIYADSLTQNWWNLIEEAFNETEFPIKEFKEIRYSQLFNESI